MIFHKLYWVPFSTNEYIKFSLTSISCNSVHLTPWTEFHSNNDVYLLLNVWYAFLKIFFIWIYLLHVIFALSYITLTRLYFCRCPFSLSDASSVPKLYSIINHTLDHVSLVYLNCRTSLTFTCVCPRYYLNTYVIAYEHKFKKFTLSRVPFSYLILCRSFSLMSK